MQNFIHLSAVVRWQKIFSLVQRQMRHPVVEPISKGRPRLEGVFPRPAFSYFPFIRREIKEHQVEKARQFFTRIYREF
jgi:hypothetical protein